MQNLYWMMTNGLNDYKDAVFAVKALQKAKRRVEREKKAKLKEEKLKLKVGENNEK